MTILKEEEGKVDFQNIQDSSDDDGLFTGTVWWESTDQVNLLKSLYSLNLFVKG